MLHLLPYGFWRKFQRMEYHIEFLPPKRKEFVSEFYENHVFNKIYLKNKHIPKIKKITQILLYEIVKIFNLY